MGLRCLIGHDFGDPEIERDRDEQGDEVVVTIREFKECSRCGYRQTVSENKEITSLASPEPEPEAPATGPEPPGPELDAEGLDEMTAEEDDGVILEDEPEPTPGREYGEWPDAPVGADASYADEAIGDPAADDEPAAWPETEGQDEGYSADVASDEPAAVTFDKGYPTTTANGSVDAGEEVIEPAAAGTGGTSGTAGGTGIASETPGPTPVGRQRTEAGAAEFVCPACDHTVRESGSSLRPGDICPECQRGYLAERAPDA